MQNTKKRFVMMVDSKQDRDLMTEIHGYIKGLNDKGLTENAALREENAKLRAMLDRIIAAHNKGRQEPLGRFWGVNYADNMAEVIEEIKEHLK